MPLAEDRAPACGTYRIALIASFRVCALRDTPRPGHQKRGGRELSPDDPDARMLKVKASQAPLESSFAFTVTDQAWDEDYTKREIKAVDLHRGDISLVGRAASPDTQGLVDIRGRGSFEQRKARAAMIGKRFVIGGNVHEELVRSVNGKADADELLVLRATAGVARARAGLPPARARSGGQGDVDIARARLHLRD